MILHGDCIEQSEQIESGSVDLILTDPPYGNMKGINETFSGYGRKNGDGHLWDNAIEPKQIFEIANRILRKNGKLILFSQEPYTSELITNAIPNLPFGYRMIWEKNDFANALLAKKAPVSYFEDILVFSKNNPKHDNTGENPVREYLVLEKQKSGLTNKDYNLMFSKYTNKVGCVDRSVIEHYWSKAQFTFPTKEIYENVLQKTGFFKKPYSEIYEIGQPYREMINANLNALNPAIFNLWEGKKYKSNILKYKKDYSGHHPTQKPVALLEDLIKTYSNENNLVVDLTCGSGSTAVAAIRTNRRFVVIEKEEKYYNIAKQRIEQEQNALKLF